MELFVPCLTPGRQEMDGQAHNISEPLCNVTILLRLKMVLGRESVSMPCRLPLCTHQVNEAIREVRLNGALGIHLVGYRMEVMMYGGWRTRKGGCGQQ